MPVVGGGGSGGSGPSGASGLSVLNGDGPPSNGLGRDGEHYIDKTAKFLYGPKASGVWPAGVSLIGPQGNTGPPGSPGTGGGGGDALQESMFASAKPYAYETVMTDPPVVGVGIMTFAGSVQKWTNASVSQDVDGSWLASFASQPAATGVVQPSGHYDAQVRLPGVGWAHTIMSGASTPQSCVDTGINVDQNNRAQAHGVYSLSFMTDAAQIRVSCWSRGGDYRVAVDGEYTQLDPIDLGGNLLNRAIDIDFTGHGDSQVRRIDIEILNGVYPYQIQIGPTDSIWPTARRPTPKLYWVGDSFTASGFRSFAHVAGQIMGCDDQAFDALGGTGYVIENAAAVSAGQTPWQNFRDRVPLNIGPGKAEPDVIGVMGSVNDKFATTTDLSAAATALFASIEDALPDAKVFCCVFGENPSNNSNLNSRATVLASACAAAPNVAGFKSFIPYLTGTGDEGSPSGSGNRDRFLLSDRTHPTKPRGHEWLGQLVAEFAKSVL